jgi:hypothetical protein
VNGYYRQIAAARAYDAAILRLTGAFAWPYFRQAA